jgi:hypothetical protein
VLKVGEYVVRRQDERRENGFNYETTKNRPVHRAGWLGIVTFVGEDPPKTARVRLRDSSFEVPWAVLDRVAEVRR